MIEATMQDFPLTITHLLRHGTAIHADSTILTYAGADAPIIETSYAAVGERAERLAAALEALGVGRGDRVGTFMWNNQRHMEAYLAVPCMGAVLHTLNIRLFPDQLAYVINHGRDRVLIVDASCAPLLAAVRPQLHTVEHIIVCGSGDTTGLGDDLIDYEDFIASHEPGYRWPDLDERSAAAMCYTSGTTGDPKGVVYSHRSCVLHSFGAMAAQTLGVTLGDRVLLIVPQFHAMAWGFPYTAWAVGADLILPQQHLQGAPLVDVIARTRPTLSAAVPTILNDVLHNHPDADLSSFRLILCGGASVPRALIDGFRRTFDVDVLQGWGMTETSPLASLGWAPRDTPDAEQADWREKTGRIVPGIEIRICADDGTVLPWDGVSQGELELRGPWVTAGYHESETPEKFHDGWLRSGDVGIIEPGGYIRIKDRSKDVIKSGGEWISSVELENMLMAHPDVVEASVVGVPDDRWDERPLACIVLAAGAPCDAAALSDWLAPRVAKWWLPERWAFVDQIPKTSVGKFNKVALRSQHEAGELDVIEIR